jgi:hypothetical protein
MSERHCGTAAGYQRHWRRGEPACAPCKAARAALQRSRYPRPEYAGRGDIARFYAKVALPNEDGCMLWLGATSYGYGVFRINGTLARAHRVSLWQAEGPPPDSEKTHAAHSCRRTDCVAPAHLRWATVVENMADKRRDGTDNSGDRHPRIKLTAADVEAIRKVYAEGGVSHRELAAQYGVSRSSMSAAIRGTSWRRVPGGAR